MALRLLALWEAPPSPLQAGQFEPPCLETKARAKQVEEPVEDDEEEDYDEEDEDDEDPLPHSVTGQISFRRSLEAEEEWGTQADLGDDTWGATIVSFARSFTVIMLRRKAKLSTKLELTHLVICVAVLVLNLMLQMGVLWYIWQFVVEPAVHTVQLRYRHFRARVLDKDGQVRPEVWRSYEFKDEVCEIAMVNAPFYYSILLVWILTNMSEWRAIERLNRSLRQMQTVSSHGEMLHFLDTGSFQKGGPCLIIGLTSDTRACIYALVIIPRALISVFLTWLGLRMLTSSGTFSDMVMNSLALGFVISIDELLCQAILPVATRTHVEETNLFIKDGHKPNTLEQVAEGDWAGFRRTAIFMIASLSYMFAYGELLQEVLPVDIRQLSRLCHPYVTTLQQPVCHQAAFYSGGPCYPSGVGSMFDMEE